MSLNPVQFGTEVIDQFGRYLMTTFPIADRDMETQVREHLKHDVGGERLIAKGPFVYLNRPFEQGPSIAELERDSSLEIHPVLKKVFPFDSIHRHQELALRAIKGQKHTVVATGTGSGKTEAFLLPIVDHALHLRDQAAREGVIAVIVYPMNALADDQLRRLRPLLAGTGITFGRYTGVTPDDVEPEQGRLPSSRPYSADERDLLDQGKEESVPIPWEECYHRTEIRQRHPRILLTNYSMLDYLLLRGRDLNLFRGAPLRFLVFDEVHTYTGAVGSEVACLIRRLRHVARKSPAEVICIGTSATVQEQETGIDAGAATTSFASRLFGVKQDNLTLVTEHYVRTVRGESQLYVPPRPTDPRRLMQDVLRASRTLQLQDEVRDLTLELLALTEKLCGREAARGGSTMERVFDLLASNKVNAVLTDVFKSPDLLSQALPRLRALDRKTASDDDLVAELLSYLTLGALVQRDGEPLLRPKLHYFLQGFKGLGCTLEPGGNPKVHFDCEAGHNEAGERIFPLTLCRSCGQHYISFDAFESVNTGGVGVSITRNAGADDAEDSPLSRVYVTNRLVAQDEGSDDDDAGPPLKRGFLCRFCGALHDATVEVCGNDKCGRPAGAVEVVVHDGDMKTCISCGTAAKGYDEIVTPIRSSEVADVTIVAQSMLTAMHEEPLQKLLVFADSRQDAAFQAGWMEERSRRFRLRHLLFAVLASEPERVWTLERLTEHMVDEAKEKGILRSGVWDEEDNLTRVRWFLLEEFATTGQRRNSLESLALAEVKLHGIAVEDAPNFYQKWSRLFASTPDQVSNLVRLILDYYRRRGVVSHPLLCRKWSDRDAEVRKGLVAVHDRYRPQALVTQKVQKSSYVKGWLASNGRSGAQEILRKGLPGGHELAPTERDGFLQDLWDWLKAKSILVETELTYKHGGKQVKLPIPTTPYQLNVEKIGIAHAEHRQICPACRRSQAVPTPSGACPEYSCRGTLEPAGRDGDHYDVHQYTQMRFAPLKPWEHSAQVPKEKRQQIEREFKRETGGRYNTLVCTPTLEMGVDIGKLEMVLMRNVPPTPANYAQRAGRAGRRHRIAVVMTHCGGAAHGRYFFDDPRSMIAGEIRVPAFSMRNDPLIRKHAHAAILTGLRELDLGEEGQSVIDSAFPTYISSYFADRIPEGDSWRPKYLKQARDLTALGKLVSQHRAHFVGTLRSIFAETWPTEDEADLAAVADDTLAGFVDDFTVDLKLHVLRLFSEVQTYRRELKSLRQIEDEGLGLTDEQETMRRRFNHALRALRDEKRQETYALSYLSADGFFPGYALGRESVTAQCLEPYMEISRPSAIALRELTPANFLYANKNIYRVRKLNFYKLRGEEAGTASSVLQRFLVFDPEKQRMYEKGSAPTEGGHGQGTVDVTSYHLTDVEMRLQQDIDDREGYRRRVGFSVHGVALSQHAGGREGKLGATTCRFLRRQAIRLVNLGMPGKDNTFSLFPLCNICGSTRSPKATEGELERFREDHKKLHGKPSTGDYALHVEFNSDTLQFGPLKDQATALNLFEALRVGSRLVLDMGTTEIEGFTITDEHGSYWAVLYDPMPGGSGFLPQIIEYWRPITEKAVAALENCPSKCETACYSCLLHFRNQQAHPQLNRHAAVNVLTDLMHDLTMSHTIPAVVVAAQADADQADSEAELNFAAICAKRSFPVPPAAQFRVAFDGGSYTDADWAYPDHKVLVFIDGMGGNLHGDPEQRRKDKLLRAKAKMKGYQVVEITAEALQDEGSLAVHLEELAVYLGVEPA